MLRVFGDRCHSLKMWQQTIFKVPQATEIIRKIATICDSDIQHNQTNT